MPSRPHGSPPAPAAGKPELLAPAGAIESFHAALDAGADAVYLGLDCFNARLRARNFTIKTLSYIVPAAHARGVKVYVTLNTLIKQAELESVVHLLHQLQQIGVDALIVQDLGLCAIARQHFPRLALHASTQMTIHNSAGAEIAARLGICRVILARELSIAEIASIARNTALELEVFVHGALCYSLSGACLASSFLGGSSGNRGRCTQVCRRGFTGGGAGGFFFSPPDLSALELLPKLIAAGVRSFKIEGRMKGPQYLHTVVSAYRAAIDNQAEIPRSHEKVRDDLGREKTTLFLTGLDTAVDVGGGRGPGTGIYLGTAGAVIDGCVVMTTAEAVEPGDYVRMQPAGGLDGTNCRVVGVSRRGSELHLSFNAALEVSPGDGCYLTSRKEERRPSGGLPGVPPAAYQESCPRAREILRPFAAQHGRVSASEELFIKIDSPGWLDIVHDVPADGVIAAFDKQETIAAAASLSDSPLKERMIFALPQFIPQHELGGWKSIVAQIRGAGCDRWMVGNLGGLWVVKRGTIYADASLWCLNRAAQSALDLLGCAGFTCSLEDDYPNVKSTADPRAMIYLYAHVPLFVSRMKPAAPAGVTLADSRGERFFVAGKHGLHYVVAEAPLCLTHRRSKLREAGLSRFVLDFSFRAPSRELLDTVLTHFRQETRIGGASLFNHKRGLG